MRETMKEQSGAVVLWLCWALLLLTVGVGVQMKQENPSQAAANDGDIERAAMKRLDFLLGQWEGDGWIQVGPDQRRAFLVSESYRYRSNGIVLDGEGTFRPPSRDGNIESATRYGLGMIFFDRKSNEYRMWHYGGSTASHVFTVKLEVDVEAKALSYTTEDENGELYRFGFRIGKDGVWVSQTELPKPDGTWHTTMEFRMHKAR